MLSEADSCAKLMTGNRMPESFFSHSFKNQSWHWISPISKYVVSHLRFNLRNQWTTMQFSCHKRLYLKCDEQQSVAYKSDSIQLYFIQGGVRFSTWCIARKRWSLPWSLITGHCLDICANVVTFLPSHHNKSWLSTCTSLPFPGFTSMVILTRSLSLPWL